MSASGAVAAPLGAAAALLLVACGPAETAARRPSPPRASVPAEAPPLDVIDQGGNRWTNAYLRDKVILIEFWATWCQPCHEMAPILKDVHQRYAPRGLKMLSISTDEEQDAFRRFVRGRPPVHSTAWASKSKWEAWNVKKLPTFFLLKDGRILRTWIGKQPSTEFDEVLADVLKSKAKQRRSDALYPNPCSRKRKEGGFGRGFGGPS